MKQRAVGYLQVIASAVLLWLSYPEVGWWPLVFPSLALLVAATDRVSAGRAAWYSFLWAMIFFLLHFSWAIVALGGSLGPWIALSTAQAAFLAAWGLFFGASRHLAWSRTWWGEAVTVAILWVGIEQLRARVPFGGFPWAKLAYNQVESPLLALAPLGGEVLVSLVVVVVAVFIRFIFAAPSRAGATLRLGLLVAVTATLCLPLFVRLPTAQQNGSIHVGAVQGNIQVPQMETFGIEGKVTENHLEEMKRMLAANPSVELVLWGENSLDRNPADSPKVAELMEEATEVAGVPLVAGFIEYVDDVRINWAGVWYPQTGLDLQKYGKQAPVPWGEYVPLRELSEWIDSDAARISVDMIAVDNPGYLEVTLNDGRVVPFAIGICFEAGIEPIFSEGIIQGGQMIVIPTNNAQFEDSSESTQQLQMARFRAAEFSRATVQVSTNGVSALIRPDGTLYAVTGKQVADNLSSQLPLRTSLTPAAVVAEPLARLSIATSLGLGVFFVVSAGVAAFKRRSK